MDECPVSEIAEKEWYRLIHVRRFRPLRIRDEQIQLLSHLIKWTRSFAETEYPFHRLDGEDRIYGSRIIRSSLYETERRHLYLCGVIIAPYTASGKLITLLVIHYQSPGICLYYKLAISGTVHYVFSHLSHFPVLGIYSHRACKHRRKAVRPLRSYRRGMHTET